MAFNVSGLPNYIDQLAPYPLVVQAIAGAKTAKLIDVRLGIKNGQSINTLDDAVVFQSQACGFNPLGDTTLGQRDLFIGPIKVDKSWCLEDLDAYYTGLQLSKGSWTTEIPFEEVLMGLWISKISLANEVALWQGDTNSGTNNLSYFDGLIKIIDEASGSTVAGNTSAATSITVSNVLAIVDAMYAACPLQIIDKPNVRLFMGFDVFIKYQTALRNANFFNYFKDGVDPSFEIPYPGYSSIILTAVHGLDGTNRMYLTNADNLVMGTDVVEENAELRMLWNPFNQLLQGTCKFKLGTQYKRPQQITQYKNA
jgi:hypothetical protein